MSKYVEGYGDRGPNDGPYLDAIDPEFVFAHAGDAEKQAQYQEDLKALSDAEVESLTTEAPETPAEKEAPEGITFTKVDVD